MQEIRKLLKNDGFKEKEIEVYLFLLKVVEATAYQISKATGVAKTTVYQTLDKLIKDGYVSEFKKNKTQYYTPESVTVFSRIAKEKTQRADQIIPHLKTLVSFGGLTKPKVRMFTGSNAVEKVFEEMLETMKYKKEKQWFIAVEGRISELFPRKLESWVAQRQKLGVYTRILLSSKSKQKDHKLFANDGTREMRILPKGYPFEGNVHICGDKAAIISLNRNDFYSIIIDSPEVSSMFKQFFNIAWDGSNTID